MNDVHERFERLLRLVLDGSCTEDDREDLSQLIVEHPGFEPELVDALSIHSLLMWQSDDVSGLMLGMKQFADENEAIPPADAPSGGGVWKATGLALPWRWAAAVFVTLAGGLLAWNLITPSRPAAIAQIVATDDVQWADDSTALRAENAVDAGRLISHAGSFTLEFRSGPTVRFSGPATVDIESDMLIALQRGQATADVPESGVGFTIKTANVHVIDHGTQFGVAAGEDGGTEVIVFEGKVDLENRIRTAAPQQRLTRGDAVRVDATGAVNRIMQVGQNTDGDWWTTAHGDLDNTIEEVRDNIPSGIGTSYSCFQIAFGGLDDDAFAYADHAHQWNGLSAQGLPAFLRGADLVRTFNDYRYIPDLEMIVTLRKPANLYVFFDDRVPTPDWLASQFEDTGVDIGLDEGQHELTPDHQVAVGGGNSIDQIFSVWSRRCVEPTPIRLGPVGPTAEARAMYGIAATPLESASWSPDANTLTIGGLAIERLAIRGLP
ncbi:MAG: FecR domain-containing protein [Planctomycetales bacterium]|nr:FecR domain-containing protein [Planctomycetales bacterium]